MGAYVRDCGFLVEHTGVRGGTDVFAGGGANVRSISWQYSVCSRVEDCGVMSWFSHVRWSQLLVNRRSYLRTDLVEKGDRGS